MQENILSSQDVVKLIINYTDGNGLKRKDLVTTHYSDKKRCYFLCSYPTNFKKPRWRAKAEIITYTPGGVYKTTTIIRDASISKGQLMIEVDLPKTWEFKQLRAGTRKNIKLPVKITFADENKLETKTEELSVSGFSLISNIKLTTTQMGFLSNCSILIPEEDGTWFENNKLEASIKYIRQIPITGIYSLENHYKYSFKFVRLTAEQTMILKKYILQYHESYKNNI